MPDGIHIGGGISTFVQPPHAFNLIPYPTVRIGYLSPPVVGWLRYSLTAGISIYPVPDKFEHRRVLLDAVLMSEPAPWYLLAGVGFLKPFDDVEEVGHRAYLKTKNWMRGFNGVAGIGYGAGSSLVEVTCRVPFLTTIGYDLGLPPWITYDETMERHVHVMITYSYILGR